jgi:hypothetical protein
MMLPNSTPGVKEMQRPLDCLIAPIGGAVRFRRFAQIHAKTEICVNLRNLRMNVFIRQTIAAKGAGT